MHESVTFIPFTQAGADQFSHEAPNDTGAIKFIEGSIAV